MGGTWTFHQTLAAAAAPDTWTWRQTQAAAADPPDTWMLAAPKTAATWTAPTEKKTSKACSLFCIHCVRDSFELRFVAKSLQEAIGRMNAHPCVLARKNFAKEICVCFNFVCGRRKRIIFFFPFTYLLLFRNHKNLHFSQ